ncbi:hypothetical protein P1X14_13700 [Sphingomonas sp. AOB5]|uniref:hypothetical protein n=1 Tax=Sphingomonas sp. AOB5 TaxID=3034017 RepID=UPI0023F8115C|nr:hypothetical protein [Sphingomonas sp. AOB5]MDF7776305.1 hypothetical protein [Sphingomonas sp. AOB5]
MIQRRSLLGLLAAAPAAAALPRMAAAKNRRDVSNVKTRPSGPIEIVYKTPHAKPNGLDLTSEGLWVMDQGPDNWISLIEPESGKLIREFKPHNVRAASGICVDDEDGTIWVGSTYNRLIVHVDPKTSNSIAAFQTPGSGLHYRMKGDAPGRRSPLKPAYPEQEPPPSPALPGNVSRLADGRVPLDWEQAPPGTGSHCILQKGKLLYITVPNARTVFAIHKESWEVQNYYSTPGNRPHDKTWADKDRNWVWASDSNMNCFFLTNINTGEVTERIQLPDSSPVIHGAKLYKGWMYCCDDVGWMFRFKL